MGCGHPNCWVKVRVNAEGRGRRAVSLVSSGRGQINSPIDYVCQGVQRGEGGRRPKIEGNTLWPGRQSSIPGGVGGVSGRNPQLQTSLSHQQRSRCGFQGSGWSDQPDAVLWGELGGRFSVDSGISEVSSIGGVMFRKAKATLCGTRGGLVNVPGLIRRSSGFTSVSPQLPVIQE